MSFFVIKICFKYLNNIYTINFKVQKMSSERKKITDLINIPGFTFSFELTPNISEDEINALEMSPVFFSVTWHAKAHQCKNLEIDPLQTVRLLKSKGKNVLLHLTCDMLRMSYLDQLLIFLKEQDICNLFVILGGMLYF